MSSKESDSSQLKSTKTTDENGNLSPEEEAITTEIWEEEQGLCEQCGINPAAELHTCPYKEDVGGDYSTLCNCCSSCMRECARDI